MRTALLAGGSAGMLALVALFLALQRKPGWYDPAVLDAAGLQGARRDATNFMDRIGDRLVAGAPFEVVVGQAELNAWLAALPSVWPAAAEHLGRGVSRPAVALGAEGVRLGAELESKGWRIIGSVMLRVRITEGAGKLGVTLLNVYGGAVPIPRVMLAGPLRDLAEQVRARLRRERRGGAAVEALLKQAASGEGLFEEFTVDNRLVWPNGRRAFRIGAIRVGAGRVTLEIEPL